MSYAGKVIFLIGAGASQSLDIPTMGGMFSEFTDRSRSNISRDDKKICDMFTREFGIKPDLEEFLLAMNTIVNAQEQVSQRLFEKICFPSMRSGKFDKYSDKLEKEVSGITKTRTNILKFMSDKCFKFKRKEACDLLNSLVKEVSLRGYPIFTTNYDFSLEYAAAEQEIDLHDNFVKQGRRHLWNPKIEYPLGGGLTLIKLHGSVTWYEDNRGEIERIETNTETNHVGQPVERLVVFPTRFKDIYEQNFFSLYSYFLSSLSKADCLIIIGHSLRDEYIRAAIIERLRLKNIKIIIIDPVWPQSLSKKEVKPARKGSSGAVTHIPVKFEDFSHELSQILSKNDPKDIAQSCASIFKNMKTKKNKLKIVGRIGKLQAGKTIKTPLSIDAYVNRDQRPVRIQGWLEKSIVNEEGEEKKEVFSSFLSTEDSTFDLTFGGTLNKKFSKTFSIPNLKGWIRDAGKVKLRIALIEGSHRSPKIVRTKSIIAEDSRDLKYSE